VTIGTAGCVNNGWQWQMAIQAGLGWARFNVPLDTF